MAEINRNIFVVKCSVCLILNGWTDSPYYKSMHKRTTFTCFVCSFFNCVLLVKSTNFSQNIFFCIISHFLQSFSKFDSNKHLKLLMGLRFTIPSFYTSIFCILIGKCWNFPICISLLK